MSPEARGSLQRALARQSRLVAVLNLIGGLAVTLSLYWSYSHLRSSTLQLRSIEREIEAEEVQAADLKAQIHSLEEQKRAYATLLNGVGPEALRQTIEKNPSAAALVPAVYIRTANMSQHTAAENIASALRADGFVIPSTDDAGSGAPQTGNQLRYYHSEDGESPELKKILGVLQGMGIQAFPQLIQVVEGTGRPRRKHYEFWFASDYVPPLSLMSNDELRAGAIALSRRLHADDLHMYDFVDQAIRSNADRVESASAGHGVPSPESVQRMARDTQALNDYMSKLMQEDVPLANEYKMVLLKRVVHPTRIVELPQPKALDFVSFNVFLTLSSSYIDELARQLPSSD